MPNPYKVRISLKDLLKIIFGGRISIKNQYDDNRTYWVQRGKSSYITRN